MGDRDVADEDAIMSVEEGGVEVGESAVPGPSESRDESEIDRRRCVLLPDSLRLTFLGARHDAHA